MQLAPDSLLLRAVFSDLPFAFTKHLQASRVDNQVGYAPPAGLPIGHCHRAGPLADTLMCRPGLPSPQSMKVSQVEIAAIDPDFTEATASIPDGIR